MFWDYVKVALFAVALNVANTYIYGSYLLQHEMLGKSMSPALTTFFIFFCATQHWFVMLVSWRALRLWALADGIDVTENMQRNPYFIFSFTTLWQMWHSSYHRWVVNYVHMPLSEWGVHNVLSVFLCFGFTGFWHGTSVSWRWWAIYNACMILTEKYVFQFSSWLYTTAFVGSAGRRGLLHGLLPPCFQKDPRKLWYLLRLLAGVGTTFIVLFVFFATQTSASRFVHLCVFMWSPFKTTSLWNLCHTLAWVTGCVAISMHIYKPDDLTSIGKGKEGDAAISATKRASLPLQHLLFSAHSMAEELQQHDELQHLESHRTLCDVLIWRASDPNFRGRAACSWLDGASSLEAMAAAAMSRAARSNGVDCDYRGGGDATAGDTDNVWGYATLYDRARRVAALLRRHGVGKNAAKPAHEQQPRALLVYPPGLDFVSAFLGCLLAGAIAVPVYPPNPHNLKRDMPIFHGCVANCNPTVVLTTAAYYLRAVVTVGASATSGGSGRGTKVAPMANDDKEPDRSKHLWPAGLPWLRTDQQYLLEDEDDEDYYYDDDDLPFLPTKNAIPLPDPPVSSDAGAPGGASSGGLGAQIMQTMAFASAGVEYAYSGARGLCGERRGGSGPRWAHSRKGGGRSRSRSRDVEEGGAEGHLLMDGGRCNKSRWEPSDIAFLQYTSGSTSAPKGVMISHANLMHHVAINKEAMNWNSRSVGVSWCPQYHDLGLVVCTLCNFFCGGHVVLFSPFTFIKDPGLWLRAISCYRAAFSAAPNFAYDLVARKYQATGEAALDLSCWEVRENRTDFRFRCPTTPYSFIISLWISVQCAGNGGERVRADTLARFTRRFAPFGFRPAAYFPCLGLAEHTIMCSGGLKGDHGELEPPTLLTVEVASMTVQMEEEAGGSSGFTSSGSCRGGIVVVAEAKLTVAAASELAATASAAARGRDDLSDDEKVQVLVGCGMPYPRVTLLIVDPMTRQLVADGDIGAVLGRGGKQGLGGAESSAVGEIWIDSGSKAEGYWPRTDGSMVDASKVAFQARLASSSHCRIAALHEKCYLRTGDLGFVHKV
jgi:acyl-CoA synthetase (AMP-forming)/AMP-acid ligase II